MGVKTLFYIVLLLGGESCCLALLFGELFSVLAFLFTLQCVDYKGHPCFILGCRKHLGNVIARCLFMFEHDFSFYLMVMEDAKFDRAFARILSFFESCLASALSNPSSN